MWWTFFAVSFAVVLTVAACALVCVLAAWDRE